MTQWYAFKAYNSQILYGFGTTEEAERYADRLNRGREVNHYAAYAVPKEAVEATGLDDNSEAFNLSDALMED